ncbi:MAG: hypothetical protein MUQ32_02350, partial [Chloroflexi bacterium]|nr:hypothetical protein [Chloroflexota bacterium]
DANHTGSSDSKTFTISQAFVRAEYTGDWFVASGTAPSFRIDVLPAVGPAGGTATHVDFSKDAVTAIFRVFPAGCSTSCPAAVFTSGPIPVTNAGDHGSTGRGVASVSGSSALADDAYLVTVELSANGNVFGERAVAAFAVHPSNSTYVVGGGYIPADSAASQPNQKGYFGFNVKKAKNSAIGSTVYIYRVRINPKLSTSQKSGLSPCADLSAACRDVDIIVRSTSLKSASTTQSSTWPIAATAIGTATIQFVDSLTPNTTYDLLPPKLTLRYDAYDAAPGPTRDTFGISVYTTSGATTTLYHTAVNPETTQTGTSVATNTTLIAGNGADISAPPGNR